MNTKETLVNLRKQQGLTQDEMAQRLFVTRQAVSRWENGNTTPNTETLKLIAQEFNVSINTILGDGTELICQSCAMPLQEANDFGTNADGGITTEYCAHCYQNGSYTHNRSMQEMIEENLKFLDEFNAQNGLNYSEDEAKAVLSIHLATLKRWKTD